MYKTIALLSVGIFMGFCSQAQVTAKATISANIVTPVGVEMESSTDTQPATYKVLTNETYSITSEEEVYYSRKEKSAIKLQTTTVNFE